MPRDRKAPRGDDDMVIAEVKIGRFTYAVPRTRDGGTALRTGQEMKRVREQQKMYNEIMRRRGR